mmetsp:Transcript_33249/g.58344  ORF Transcript_33249/g.58344 Transcript_33249/m.58344 type:complete len:386 (+) Transcript_33249:5964-7121(+)|eukprot:CAMPEP_0204896922 /NCGR_PEP_ID=MMETSP1397-20131031/447_1 /ASSEMBLY_ACC=CAM_ASM_000891 /TAXON_ID=49980 /ORGANISM="Climacostomum Climacostomum virens, Strain Stock W-24" /LENGTH=385 /DNA_ID=CAMNT_0052064607 /DNA_START=289 /DNA_END=1446 /DNA_ORIENTATION=+
MNKALLRGQQLKAYTCSEILGKSYSALTAAFSNCGMYLAVGSGTGYVHIYSFLTHSVIFSVSPNAGKVIALKWVNERVCAVTDANSFFCWNMMDSTIELGPIHFDFKLKGLDVHPDRASVILTYGKSDIVLTDIVQGTRLSLARDAENAEWFGVFLPDGLIVTLATPPNVFYVVNCAGDVLYTQTLNQIFTSAIKDFKFDGDALFLANSRDRALRLFDIKRDPFEFRFIKEVSDAVERKRWYACSFFKAPLIESSFVIACLQETGSHMIKLFDTVEKETRVSLARSMHSPLGAASELTFSNHTHIHPVICVVTQACSVLLWTSKTFMKKEPWSTSLGIPNFIPLEEGNVEYEEAEDEFDKPPDTRVRLNLRMPSQVYKPYPLSLA